MTDEHGRAPLLERRVPVNDIELGVAYVIHARNGGVGVAVQQAGSLGYRLHREKFGRRYLFVEYDWDVGEPHGTAIPLERIDAPPPTDDAELLAWLRDREAEHQDEIARAWQVVLETLRG